MQIPVTVFVSVFIVYVYQWCSVCTVSVCSGGVSLNVVAVWVVEMQCQLKCSVIVKYVSV